jgi:PAS domain S-box-containing protein
MRVLIVDDHEIVRRGIRSLLISQVNCDVCGEAVDGQDAVEKAKELKPDVIVMDVSMPNLNGLDATRQVRRILPQTEVLILSQHDSAEMVRQAFQAGARGYVVKSSISRQLVAAFDKVSRHEPFLDNSAAETPASSSPLGMRDILQRSATLEQALRESEELYRSTFDEAPVGVAHVNPDGQWLRVNKQLCNIVGYAQEELLSLKYQDITHPEDLAEGLARAEELIAGRSDRYSMHKRYVRKDGSIVWVNLTVSCVRNLDRTVKHFISIVEDATERQDGDVARSRLASIVESSDDAIISKDLNGVITSWNGGAHRIFGYTSEEMVGRHITTIIPPELQDEENGILLQMGHAKRIDHFETIRVAKNGERVHVSLSLSPVKDSGGKVIGVSKIARNITERTRAEEARFKIASTVEESEKRLRAAFSQTYSILMLLSPDGSVVEANQAALEGMGFTRSQVIGRKCWEPWWAALPKEVETLKSSVARAAQGEVVRENCSYCTSGGTVRFADRTLAPVRDEDGNVVLILASALDITEQKELLDRLEQRVRARTQELEQKNAELRKLSARLLQVQDEERRRIARELHDSVGQLLAAVSMNISNVSMEKYKLSGSAAAAVSENMNLVEQVSNEIRTLSHLLHPPLLDEIGLLSALKWYIDGFSERSKIKVTADIPADLGRLPRDVELSLFRIVQECLTNIHRHSGSPTAIVRLTQTRKSVTLEVKDEGRGFSPSGGPTISGGDSPGVGLRGMRERVTQLGGQLEITSNATGTAVLARLPLGEGLASAGHAPAEVTSRPNQWKN